MTITLHWKALQQPTDDYLVFVHVVDQSDRLCAQHDSQPRTGQYPSSAWSPGELVADFHQVHIPSEYQGLARLFVGLYRFNSLERLPIVDSQGTDFPNRALFLSEISVSMSPQVGN